MRPLEAFFIVLLSILSLETRSWERLWEAVVGKEVIIIGAIALGLETIPGSPQDGSTGHKALALQVW